MPSSEHLYYKEVAAQITIVYIFSSTIQAHNHKYLFSSLDIIYIPNRDTTEAAWWSQQSSSIVNTIRDSSYHAMV